MMKYFPVTIMIAILFVSCKTEFEKVRTSNDPETTYKAANQYYESENYLNAQVLYEIAIPYYRGKEEAEDLYFKFAYTYYHLGDYILASHYFKNFAKSFYASPNREEAEFMEAYSKYKLSPNYKLDQSYSGAAIDALQNFINKYPESEKVAECNTLIDDIRAKLELKAFTEAKLYYDLKNYNSAITSAENMLIDFPDTKRGEEVRFLILQASYNWAKNSVFEKKEERLKDCIKKHAAFTKKYRASEYKKEATKILEDSEKELKFIENVRLKNAGTEY